MNLDKLNNSIKKPIQQNLFKDFLKIGLPNRKVENWKYTPLSKWLSDDYSLKETSPIIQEKSSFNYHLDFSNGKITNSDLPNQIKVTEQVIDQELLNRLSSSYELNDLQRSTLQSAYKIEIDGICNEPVNIRFLNEGEMSLSSFHLDFEIASDSSVTFFNEYNQEDDFHLSSQIINLDQNSKACFFDLKDSSNESKIIDHRVVNQKENSNYTQFNINTNSRLNRDDLIINLNEMNATSKLYGIYLLDNEQHCDHQLTINHLAAETYSSQLYKGVLNHSSKSAFTGKVYIAKDSQRVNADQLNQNLILSDKATAHSRPQLEIFADDVKCAHGSATAQISNDQRFYLESRGISKDRANHLLGLAYVKEVLFEIENKEVRDLIEVIVEKKLNTWKN